ncbi:dihydrodipicolinate synthase family protein [Microbacterium sp. KR10-403]|uniref:dihydrodipicolinate synthase family protein n=1 Tax=Microbacterium sp. KR10-403 TaxID=3158581 RepID=UPI0032E41D60
MVSDLIGERLFVAACTPMREDESIDFDSLASLVDTDIRRGVEGVYVGGSTGEGMLLSAAERIAVARTAVESAQGRVPVFAHVGAMTTREALELAAAVQAAGVAAISMIPPLYYGYSTADVIAHYREVIDAVDIPFVVYNIPQFTGRDIVDGGYEELMALPQVIGIKHTSQNLFGAERLVAQYPDVQLINGFDELYLPALSMGATASIGTTVGLQIELFLSLRERARNGDFAGARTVQVRINETLDGMVREEVFGAAKYLVGKYAVGCGRCRRPLRALDDESLRRLDLVWEQLQRSIEETAQEDRSAD